MHYPKRNSLICLIALVATSMIVAPVAVYAGTFRNTRVMDLKYGWGTPSLADFDAWDMTYPGYFPIAEITFEPDGSFTAYDTASGSTGYGFYDKRGRNLEITIINPQLSYIIQYVGRKESRGVFAGEILIDGNVSGHWRGAF